MDASHSVISIGKDIISPLDQFNENHEKAPAACLTM
jgi:hypothetical protein